MSCTLTTLLQAEGMWKKTEGFQLLLNKDGLFIDREQADRKQKEMSGLKHCRSNTRGLGDPGVTFVSLHIFLNITFQ